MRRHALVVAFDRAVDPVLVRSDGTTGETAARGQGVGLDFRAADRIQRRPPRILHRVVELRQLFHQSAFLLRELRAFGLFGVAERFLLFGFAPQPRFLHCGITRAVSLFLQTASQLKRFQFPALPHDLVNLVITDLGALLFELHDDAQFFGFFVETGVDEFLLAFFRREGVHLVFIITVHADFALAFRNPFRIAFFQLHALFFGVIDQLQGIRLLDAPLIDQLLIFELLFFVFQLIVREVKRILFTVQFRRLGGGRIIFAGIAFFKFDTFRIQFLIAFVQFFDPGILFFNILCTADPGIFIPF